MITIGAIIGCISSLAETLAVAGLAVQGLKSIVGILVNTAKALGLVELPGEEQAEKALQSDLEPDNFETFDDYLKELDKFEIDPNKKHSPDELLSKEAELLSGVVLNKEPLIPIEGMINAVAKFPNFLNESRMNEISNLCGGSPEKLNDVFGLINGTEKNISKLQSGENLLIETEKRLDPTLKSDEDALARVYNNL